MSMLITAQVRGRPHSKENGTYVFSRQTFCLKAQVEKSLLAYNETARNGARSLPANLLFLDSNEF